jgi:hypothetical protein
MDFVTKKQTHIVYGLITGAAMVIFSLLVYVTKLDDQYPVMRWAPYVPVCIGIILNALAYSKANSGSVTFGNVFGSCFKASLIVTAMTAIYIILCVFLFPGMMDKYMTIARQSMEKNPQMTDEMMATSMAIMKKAYAPMMVLFTGLYTLMAGTLFSLIGGAVARKNVAYVEVVGEPRL